MRQASGQQPAHLMKETPTPSLIAEPETDSPKLHQIQLDKPLECDPDYPGFDYTSLTVKVLNGAVQAEVCVDEAPLERTALTAEEQRALQRCETVIQRTKQSFYEFALALEEVKRRKLYRDCFTTFPEYCKSVHGLGKSYAYQYAAAGKLLQEKSTTVEKVPENAHQASKLIAKAAKTPKSRDSSQSGRNRRGGSSGSHRGRCCSGRCQATHRPDAGG